MKYTTIVASAFALGASFVTAAPSLEKRFCLTTKEAETIVAKFISVLEGVDYEGQSPNVTAVDVVAADYHEYSDSIQSLEDVPLSDTPSATSRTQWYSEVSKYPDTGIETLDIFHSCDKIAWYWLFPDVGSGQYRVKGSNLFTINKHCKITSASIEFNSIAWGLDTQQIYEYCPTANSTSTATSTASASAAPTS